MIKKVLIVEDDREMATLLAERMKAMMLDAVIAPDAMIAKREVLRWRPDLVILDLKIPAGGGVGVLKTMRQSPETMMTPVIVLTGADSSAVKDVMALGIKDYFTKPYDPALLTQKIREILS